MCMCGAGEVPEIHPASQAWHGLLKPQGLPPVTYFLHVLQATVDPNVMQYMTILERCADLPGRHDLHSDFNVVSAVGSVSVLFHQI